MNLEPMFVKNGGCLAFSALLLAPLAGLHATEAPAPKPNVLFVIADDASPHFGQTYGCAWVKTPNIERLARSGLVFDNAYTPTAKCAPSRSAILTGRNPWQLEDAANHQSQFPVKFKAFSEALREAGITDEGEMTLRTSNRI